MTDCAPVLRVDDPAAALAWFARLPGVGVDPATGCVTCGAERIIVTGRTATVTRLRALPFDHLALRVGRLDAPLAGMLAGGDRLHRGYTPDAPREIAAFWERGVRFAFLEGPGGVPVELCERLGEDGPEAVTGIDHLGLRCADVGATAARFAGAERLAGYRLEGPVEVLFLRETGLVWELFDERPVSGATSIGAGWIGVVPI